MRVLSLFDGISCARVALERVGIPVEAYYASEIDKYAIQISQKNYPDIIQVGDVKFLTSAKNILCRDATEFYDTGDIDLLIGGSPCQDLSIAKRNRKGLDGERSGLFWEYVRILKEVKPKYFILENVASMRPEDRDIISKTLGVEPVMFNASLVSAQMRKRLFWTNIKFTLPEDRNIKLKDVLIDGIAEKEKSLVITATYSRACPQDYFGRSNRQLIKVGEFNSGGQGDRVYSIDGKSVTLSALGGGRGAKTGLYETTKGIYRKLHPIECERLQGLPDGYTDGVSNTQRYKACGNAFNVDVVVHILSFIPKE